MTEQSEQPAPTTPAPPEGYFSRILWIIKQDTKFWLLLIVAFVASIFGAQYAMVAAWMGFVFAAYSAVANDSIQTLGTFIASNKSRPWWVLWLFIGGIFVVTMTMSWMSHGGGMTASFYNEPGQEGSPDAIDLVPRTTYDFTSTLPEGIERGFEVVLEGDYVANADLEGTFAIGECDGTVTVEWDGELLVATDGPTAAEWSVSEGDRTPLRVIFEDTGERPLCRLGLLDPEDDEVDVTTLETDRLFNSRYGGDVSYGRLSSKGFDKQPSSFSFLQVAAPLFLLILTRLRMPVSTTFLLLTAFATESSAVGKVLSKSMMGYFLAFGVAMAVWLLLGRWMKERWTDRKIHPAWYGAQWITSGWLWSVWLQQDAANIAVFLPRSLSPAEFAAFLSIVFLGLGLLFLQQGERIQEVVDEKSDVMDVRMATVIDFVYGFILFYFKLKSKIPMSTTWVFIGLLGGRELALTIVKAGKSGTVLKTMKMMGRDFLSVTIGLLVSMALAVGINEQFRYDWLGIGEPPETVEEQDEPEDDDEAESDEGADSADESPSSGSPSDSEE